MKRSIPAAALLFAAACLAQAAPFTPKSDNEVVERLPVSNDPALRTVESLRRQLAAKPDDGALRLDIAQRYFDLAMAQGDPRFVGYAMATITPLQKSAPNDARYWLLRGLLLQYGHDFDGAIQSLDRASAIDASAVDPVAWRAAIRMVQAKYAEAERECERLAAIAMPLHAQGCSAYVRASRGGLNDAYTVLSQAVSASKDVPPSLTLWLHTRLAEMAVRLQRWDDAERHFRAALGAGITDQFLLGAYADFLLMRQRPAEVLQLLAGWERSDVLLLRLALAGRAAKEPRATDWNQQLRERFEAAAQRGDRLHEQEAARWALELEGNPARALQFARSNYEKQKEPRDAEVLLRAAIAAKQPAAAQPVVEWLRVSRYEDPVLQALAGQVAR